MVAQASERVVTIADASKLVAKLGTTFALPVEVVRWGWEAHARFLRSLGADVALRVAADGQRFATDNGNFVLDCRFAGGIEDPRALEEALAHIMGHEGVWPATGAEILDAWTAAAPAAA
jgi:ribose 5-phosphate isomerase A